MVPAYAVRLAALFHGRLYLHVFVPGGVISKMCCRTSSCALVMEDGLGQPGTIGSCLRGQRGSRTSAPPPRSQSNSRLPALGCTSCPAPGIPATRRSTPPILRAQSPIACDRPWPTRQPPSGLDRGLLAALVLSWVEFLLL